VKDQTDGKKKGPHFMEHGAEMEQQQLALTISQAAKRLGISRSLLYKLLKKGEGPPTVQFGRSTRVQVTSLQKWVEQREKDQLGG
jgi:excisionase family DNA binding protein